MNVNTLATGVLVCVLASPAALSAQRRASEPATVSQVANGTRVIVEYSRPAVRERTLFGEGRPFVVHWGEVWTPGANWATTFEVDRDVELNGQPVPKGKYSLWMIPQADLWTVLLSTNARRYHTNRPDQKERKDELVRFTVKPQTASHAELLTFEFPHVRRDGVTLHFRWGTTLIPLDIKVLPPQRIAVSAADRAQYVGEYVMKTTFDTTRVIRVRVTEDGEFLRGHAEPMFFRDFDAGFDLNPRGDALRPMMYKKGELFDEEDIRFVFQRGERQATGFVVYGPAGRVFAEGTRVR